MANTEKKEVEEVVSVPKDKWDAVMSRLEALESKPGGDFEVIGADDDSERQLTARVKFVDGLPISRVCDVVETGFDENTGKPVMRCTIVTVGKDGKEILHKGKDYTSMRNDSSRQCPVVETKVKKMTKKGDLVDEMVFDEKRNSAVPTGRKVYAAVNYLVTKHVIDIDGEKYELDNVNL